MSLLHARGLSLRYGKKVILEDESFALAPHDRVGLIGPNGTGKTTLLRILSGRLAPDAGEVQLVRRARAGYLPQEISELPDGALIDGVLLSVPGRAHLQERIAAAEEALALAVGADAAAEALQLELSGELADLHEELQFHEERYGKHRAEEILLGLGFSASQLARPARELSGGWRMRAALAALLLQDPELLLLDEPTNHLDVPTLEWFDEFLARSRKALLLVTHDREFLDRQVGRILSFEPEGLRSYAGNYEAYLERRAEELSTLRARADKQEKQRAQTMAFIERFRASATKARQVQSRVKMLDKEERIELPEERATVRFRFPEAPRSGREVLRLEGIDKSYGDRVVYTKLSGQLLRGERIAVIGLNGAGKTTLLKLVAGEVPPDAGKVALGHNVALGYFAQHHTERLDPARTILEEVHTLVPTMPQSQVRGILGAFLFSGDDVDKKIGVLSGGERARVALAKLLVLPSNFLLMDEPTNHLDLDSSETLIEALSGYEGTLLFVSHNRSFVNGLATQVWEVKDGGIDAQPGNLDDWHRRRAAEAAASKDASGLAGNGAASDAGTRAAGPGKESRRERAADREKRQRLLGPLRKEIAQLEERIAALEAEKKGAEAQLSDPALFADAARSSPLVKAYREAEKKLEELYGRWERKQEELAAAETAIEG
ncbi:MAG TPA: ABC-F family ATP-binding cassette domain-containing protein [Myxococcales bacterium]|jgi:ATP-binding cassette, subfamily F, member 3|nr:ABC-F family ATP-binding cassette domain-containing protein [Myxococcales bacterium]